MSELLERPLDEQLAEANAKLALLEEAAWGLLSALETGNQDEIVKAKRKLGFVFLDL